MKACRAIGCISILDAFLGVFSIEACREFSSARRGSPQRDLVERRRRGFDSASNLTLPLKRPCLQKSGSAPAYSSQ